MVDKIDLKHAVGIPNPLGNNKNATSADDISLDFSMTTSTAAQEGLGDPHRVNAEEEEHEDDVDEEEDVSGHVAAEASMAGDASVEEFMAGVLTEIDPDDETPHHITVHNNDTTNNNKNQNNRSRLRSSSSLSSISAPRPIPLRKPPALLAPPAFITSNAPPSSQQQQQQGQPSSAGSTESGFLSSLMHQQATSQIQSIPASTAATTSNITTNNSNINNPPVSSLSLLSHTPPGGGGPSSYEASHFGKRARSGSVSGRLRSASDYLEQRGLLDGATKGILKDLIIIGDEELQHALDAYELGNAAPLEEMISSGALQNRLPQDLDLMGNLDLDFLTMEGDNADPSGMLPSADNIEPLQNQSSGKQQQHLSLPNLSSSASAASLQNGHHQQSRMADDGIGELEFGGDLGYMGHHEVETHHHQHHHPGADNNMDDGGAAPTSAGDDDEDDGLSAYDRRMRSNSLFTALWNDPNDQEAGIAAAAATSQSLIGVRPSRSASLSSAAAAFLNDDESAAETLRAMVEDTISADEVMSTQITGITVKPAPGGAGRRRSTGETGLSGIGASLQADQKKKAKEKKSSAARELKKLEREKKKQAKLAAQQQEMQDAEEAERIIPGSGRPRSLSDPNLRASVDEDGLRNVERPDGWVGAYSPESRRVRIDRFMEKRNHRVWTKSVKYDVRKNFADSRLRVKGRFVKKEDELLMRELMSLT